MNSLVILLPLLVSLTACGTSGLFGPPPTPTLIPTPTPVPTPTPQPSTLVDDGLSALLHGSWDEAGEIFDSVALMPGAPETDLIDAQIGSASAMLRSGDFNGAKMTFDAIIAAYPSHPTAAKAYFLRGEAYSALGLYNEAVYDYQSYLAAKPGLVDSFVYERIGDTQIELGQYNEAKTSYLSATTSDRAFLSMLVLREKVAGIARTYGDAAMAVDQYNKILEAAQNPYYRAQIELYIGQAWFEVGDEDQAYPQWQYVFDTYPATYEALSALRALIEKDFEIDQYQRGLVNYYNGQYEIAIEAFYNYIAGTPVLNYPIEVFLYTSRSYLNLGNPQAAQQELISLVEFFSPEDGAEWGDAWLELAYATGEMGDLIRAYEYYDEFISEHPELSQHPDAMAEAGALAEENADYPTADAYFTALKTAYPEDTRPAEAFFRMGYTSYISGDLANAEIYFNRAVSMTGNEYPAEAWLWLGKTLAALNRPDEASTAFQTAADLDPSAYASIRASEMLAGTTPFTPPSSISFPLDENESREEAENWLIDTFALPYSPPIAEALRADIATDSRMIRGLELWELGLVMEAREDFEAVRSDFSEDALASYQLAIFFRDTGLYRSSILAARSVRNLAELSVDQMPVFIARLEYPVYYHDLVMADAEEYGLDPLYVFSLIRQESLFEGFAESTASAQGVMQIWPPTGSDIALNMPYPEYEPTDLQRPSVNIAFGTWLLNDEFNRQGGDPYAVLAAYNAGTGNALTWTEASAGDPDRYYQSVNIYETQLYIQLISEHYRIYSLLYGD